MRSAEKAEAGWLYRSLESARSYARENPSSVTQVKQSVKGPLGRDADNLPRNRKV
jgi:hypothetical protein